MKILALGIVNAFTQTKTTEDALCNRRSPGKIPVIIHLIACLHFHLLLPANLHAQDMAAVKVTIGLHDEPLVNGFKMIEQQSKFRFTYNKKVLSAYSRINLPVATRTVRETIGLLLANTNLTYKVNKNTVGVFEKKAGQNSNEKGQTNESNDKDTTIRGRVVTKSGQPLEGVSITVKGSSAGTSTDKTGSFVLQHVDRNATLYISYVGYKQEEIKLNGRKELNILLNSLMGELDSVVVVNTGYQLLPKERATGSFTHVDSRLLSSMVTTNILDRLEGVVNGMNFERANIFGENPYNERPKIRVRGIATLESNEDPLIIVDNFPYEGDINNINPNDIESITVLKDAAAASIWGARAGNGVIVITTKQGRYQSSTSVSFVSNTTIGRKPDLYYSRNFLPASVVMNIEEELFNRGDVYPEEAQTVIPPYVELLIKRRDNLISGDEFNRQKAVMEGTDTRAEALKYLYQSSVNQQYSLSIRGGSNRHRYYLSGGYDNNRHHVAGNSSSRLNLAIQNSLQVTKDFELDASLWYTNQQNKSNGITYTHGLASGSLVGISPYLRLADVQGNPLPVPAVYRQAYTESALSNGLLDWGYRPLDEIRISDNRAKSTELRLNLGATYRFLKYFNLNLKYQFVRSQTEGRSYYSPESYYVRNLVNRFTQPDGTRVIPNGGILDGRPDGEVISHSGRIQMNFRMPVGKVHEVTALAGAEIRQQVAESLPGYRLYNYDRNTYIGSANYDYSKYYPVLPVGAMMLPAPAGIHQRMLDRFISYFANAANTFLGKYTVSGSVRWDASNLFGVKTNQKGVPLWSIGGAWELSKEDFFQLKGLSYLRLRLTYGSSGNVNPNVTAYPVLSFSGVDARTQFPRAALISAGNPNLRWEKVNTVNAGVDFGWLNNRITGSVEYYVKNAYDLIGTDYMDPTTGIIEGAVPVLENRINYADLKTYGVDIQLNARLLTNRFRWDAGVIFNFSKNRIQHYNTAKVVNISTYMVSPPPAVGQSRDVVYALPWYGLDHQTGKPLVLHDGQLGMDYQAYYNSRTADDLLVAGVSVPPYFGAFRNTIAYKGIQLSANIIWKAGHVFRRSSIAPGAEYNGPGSYHMDYFLRWKKPGDEQYTNVPAASDTYNTYEATAYTRSAALITRGDYIRLQDVNLSYTYSGSWLQHVGLKQVRMYCYVRNVGLLWTKNKVGLDPEYTGANYPSPRTYAFGINLDF